MDRENSHENDRRMISQVQDLVLAYLVAFPDILADALVWASDVDDAAVETDAGCRKLVLLMTR